MKRTTGNRILIAFVAIVSLIAFSDIFAQDQKAPAQEKAQVTAKAPIHQAGSAACLEAHKSGKCTGHDPGACVCNGNCGGNCGRTCGKHDSAKVNCSGGCGNHAAKKKV